MAMLRKLGKLAGVLLEDQLARQRQAYGSELTQQRQEEVYRHNIADKVMTNLAPKLAAGDITPEAIEGFDTMPPELQAVLKAHASTAPSAEQRSGVVMGEVDKNIMGAKTPDELGTLGGRFDEARNAMHAKRLPIGLGDVTNLANTFNGQADQLANADITKRERDIADAKTTAQNTYDIGHPEEKVVFQSIGANGKPSGPLLVQDPNVEGGYRPVTAQDKLKKDEVHYIQSQPQWNNGQPAPTPPLDQTRLEQQYRTMLLRALSSRSGGLGLEDQKVNQAIHLKAIFDQSYNPKTGEYSIPSVMTKEVAMGLARLISPTGQVGIELMKEFVQPTVSGDLARAATYLTGKPTVGNTQDVLRMFKESIDRQAEVAESNREGYLDAIRQWAPTDLEESRRQQLEGGLLKLNRYTQPDNVEQGHDIPVNGVERVMARPVRK